MIDFKKYFSDSESSHLEEERYEGLTCTCPKEASYEISHRKVIKKKLHIPWRSDELEESNHKSILQQKQNRRNVSLGQILGTSCDKVVAVVDQTERRRSKAQYAVPLPKALTSSGSSFCGSTDNSPDGQPSFTKGAPRELTDFEKDNLLFLQELKSKQNNPHRHLETQVGDLPYPPYRKSFSYPSNESSLYELYLEDNTAPRGGSPFPRRREFPASAFSPSKTASSQVLRSLSLEEVEDESESEDNEDVHRTKLSNERPQRTSHSYLYRNGSNGGYKGLSRSCDEKSQTTSQQSPTLNAWWSHRSYTPTSRIKPLPAAMSPLNSPSIKRRAGSPPVHGSLPSGYTRSTTPTTPATAPVSVPGFQSSMAKLSFASRSHSSPAPNERKTFVPHDLSLSFMSFGELPKCRPELEDVGGQVKSILSTSPEEESTQRRSILPTTPECVAEDITDEENSRKTEPKFLQTEPSTKLSSTNEVQNTNSGTPPKEPFGNKLPIGTHQNDSPGRQLHSSDPVLPDPVKKPTPMAFTVELGDSAASDSSGSGSTGKKLDITASISQWAPKHRRNLSLTKVEENKKVEERQGSEKPPLGRPRSGTVGAGGLQSARRGGYHSEGYFSSDQDDEGPKRTDLKSPRSPRAPPPDTLKPSLVLVRSTSQDSSKGNSLRKQGSKSEGRSCCKERERKPSVSELTGKTYKSDKNNGSKMVSDSIKQGKNTPTEDIDSSRDVKDDVSETGTYTIDKDSPSPDVDEARNDIDGIFGITTESEVEANSTTTAVPMSTTDQCPEDESSWMSASEVTPAISRNSPNWIQQWAAHVAEQTKPTLSPISSLSKSSVTSPRGNKLPLSSQESNDSRPRRKLPTPPSHLIPSPVGVAQRSLDVTDSPTPLKHRFWQDSTLSSDLTSDTEAFLRDTENIVTSLQARVDKTKGESPAFRNASFESHESGGDSDIDTSTSYPFNDDERFSASLRSKLRLTGLLPSSKNSTACVSSPRRLDGGTVKDPKLKNRELGREGTYEAYAGRRDEHGLHSDSSSEASEPFKETSRSTDSNNPPLKFNRAFSLRRARLGCEEPVSTTPIDKKKINRPSSAGAVGSSRKAPLATTKSYQSVDSSSVSSPRGYGFGSPRGIASSSQNVLSKGTSSDNFDRTDGGRFSLRLPRSGPTSIGIVKSPSKSSIKKETTHSSHKKTALRSNSTLSSKEVDFQNWKRRKNYDPMKAAAEGKKKQVERKTKNILTSVPTSSDNRSPSPVANLLRSASFHGTEGVMGNVRWTRKNCINIPHYTNEDDGPCSLEEDVGPHPSPRRGSPIRRSPTSPHQLCQSPAKQTVTSLSRGRRPSLGLSDEGENQYQSSIRKISLDESGSEGKRSPLNGGHRAGGASGNASSGSGRPKTKMEALDNLVISTIHSLSVKVRTTSESLLQKLKSQYDEEGDRAALLEEVLSHLSESDQSVMSGQTRSTSRELAGILRNLKKIEHALEVIDRVIVIGDEEYPEEELEEVPNEWVESDY